MDIRVETAVSVAEMASLRMVGEQDCMEVIENPMGLYLGLTSRKASFNRLILLKMLASSTTLSVGEHCNAEKFKLQP
jgi:hypothetical protein